MLVPDLLPGGVAATHRSLRLLLVGERLVGRHPDRVELHADHELGVAGADDEALPLVQGEAKARQSRNTPYSLARVTRPGYPGTGRMIVDESASSASLLQSRRAHLQAARNGEAGFPSSLGGSVMTTVRALVKALVIAAEWTLFAAAAAYGLIHGDWLIVGIASAFAAAAALAVVRRRHRSALVVPPAAERHAVRHGLGVRRTRRIR